MYKNNWEKHRTSHMQSMEILQWGKLEKIIHTIFLTFLFVTSLVLYLLAWKPPNQYFNPYSNVVDWKFLTLFLTLRKFLMFTLSVRTVYRNSMIKKNLARKSTSERSLYVVKDLNRQKEILLQGYFTIYIRCYQLFFLLG